MRAVPERDSASRRGNSLAEPPYSGVLPKRLVIGAPVRVESTRDTRGTTGPAIDLAPKYLKITNPGDVGVVGHTGRMPIPPDSSP